MKKLFIVLVIAGAAAVILFATHGKKDDGQQTTSASTELQEVVSAKSSAEVYEYLTQEDSKRTQMYLYTMGNQIVRKALLDYEELSPEVLIEICKNFNLDTEREKCSITNAIIRADLSKDQRWELAQIRQYPIQRGILQREDLDADLLLFILRMNMGEDSVLDFDNVQIKHELSTIVFEMPYLTVQQKLELDSFGLEAVSQAVRAREEKINAKGAEG